MKAPYFNAASYIIPLEYWYNPLRPSKTLEGYEHSPEGPLDSIRVMQNAVWAVRRFVGR